MMTQPTRPPPARTPPPGYRAPAPVTPEPRAVLPALVGLGALLLVLAVVIGASLVSGRGPAGSPTPTPTASQPPSATPSAQPATPSATGEAQPGAPDLMPSAFGPFTSLGPPNRYVTSYQSETGFLMVSYRPTGTVADARLEEPTATGAWTCGRQPGKQAPACATAAHGGFVEIHGLADPSALVAAGQQLLDAWK